MGIKKALQIWNAKEVNILSEKETRVLQPQDTPNYENRNIDKSNAPARPAPMPKTKK